MYQILFLLSVLALHRSTATVQVCGGTTLDGYHVGPNPYGVKNDGVVGFGPDNMYDYTGSALKAWGTVTHPTHKKGYSSKTVDVYGTQGKIGRAHAIVEWQWDPNITRLIGFFSETCYLWCQASGFNHVTFLVYKDGTGIGTYKGSITLSATRKTCERC